jgi:hypothetical protein
MIVLVVVSLMLVPALEALRGAVRGTAESVRVVRVTQLGRSLMSAVESFSYEDLDARRVEELVRSIRVPEGVQPPRLEGIEEVRRPLGAGAIEAKVVSLRIEWLRAEGGDTHGRIVVVGVVARAR